MKIIKLIFVLFLILSLESCKNNNEKSSEKISTISKSFDSNEEYRIYTEVVKNLKTIEIDDLKNKESLGDKFIFFSRVTCPYCRKFVSNMKNILQKNNLEIYYVNMDVDYHSESLDKILDMYQVSEVPTLVFVNSEGLVSKYVGDNFVSLDNFISNNKKLKSTRMK